MIWHCWLGDRKGIRPVNNWMLVCWWWRFDWTYARLIASVVSTTSIILSSNKIQNRDILILANPIPPGKMAIKIERKRLSLSVAVLYCWDLWTCHAVVVSQYCDDQSTESLNRECCLTALAAVRQAKWFQVWVSHCAIWFATWMKIMTFTLARVFVVS